MDEQTVGKHLFGRWARLAVARWALHQESAFYQGEAAAGVGYAISAIRQELDRLVDLDMLHRFHDTRRVYYTRTDSPLWEIIAAADRVVPRAERESAKVRDGGLA